MDSGSTSHIVAIEQKLDKFINSQEKVNAQFFEKLDKISRGVYGDTENGQVGLITRIKEVEELTKRVKKLELFRSVTIYALITLLVVIGVIGPEEVLTFLIKL